MKKIFFLSTILCSFFMRAGSSGSNTSPLHVEIKNNNGAYQLLVNGSPYFIQGAGGYKYYDRLKELGGNSVRLWSTDGEDARKYLDKAHSLGLTVTLGLDMGHERTGFNYSDTKAVKAQFEKLKKDILLYKDHPALLMWGVGNEVDQFANNFAVWDAVNDLVKYIHEVDPHHPTTTMLAGVPKKHVREIVKRIPTLDLLSINAFKWMEPVRPDITSAGWKGAYLIGEWGASGYWESEMVPWKTFIEETSSDKARVIAERYEKHVLGNKDRCLGSYVFYWGWKQARTHTLLSLFTENGEETAALDVLHKMWTGKTPVNSAPAITPIGIDTLQTHRGIYLKPSSDHMAYMSATDPDGDKLYYYWEIYPESTEKKEGGDMESKPVAIQGLIGDTRSKSLSFKAPVKPGAYRVFITVYDGKNHVASANAPFYVRK